VETLTDAVIDTVALVRHLEDRLPDGAERVFDLAEAGESQLFIPEIALGEFVYLALRGHLKKGDPRSTVEEVLDTIRGSGYIALSSLGPSGWGRFLELDVPELHDRMIAADALSRGLPLVTNDPELFSVPGLSCVWK
jgi:predicted nucleic acid-binding protein